MDIFSRLGAYETSDNDEEALVPSVQLAPAVDIGQL